MKKGGLGRGLDALYEDNSAAFPDEETQDGVRMARLSAIEPNRKQPRQNFDPAALSELAESIRTHGILQPLLVRRVPGSSLDGESYQLVAGERRWRAARMAGLSEVPVVVREMTEEEVLEFALIENLQREDLNPLEEAEGYQRLVKTFGLTQEEVAKKVGRSRSAVANSLRLLKLPMDVQAFVQMGDLSVGHAKALLSVQDEWKQSRLAEKAVQKGLSVRQLEQLCEAANQPEPDEAPSPGRITTTPRCSWRCRMGLAAGSRSTSARGTRGCWSSPSFPRRICRRSPTCWRTSLPGKKKILRERKTNFSPD